MLCGILAKELAILLPLSQLNANHIGQQLLSFNQRYLYVSVRVTLQSQLTAYALRQALEDGCIGGRQLANDILDLLIGLNHVELSLVGSENVIQLGDKFLDSGDEFDQALGNQNGTKVHAACSTVGNNLSDISYDIIECLVLGLNLLTYQGDVRLSLQSALQRSPLTRRRCELTAKGVQVMSVQ